MYRSASGGRSTVMCFFFQAEDGIRDYKVTGVQTCALPISPASPSNPPSASVALSAEQAQALGVRFEPIQAAQRIEVSAHARVVLRPDAQAVVAAPYAGAVPRVLVALGQTVRTGQPVAVFTSPQRSEEHTSELQSPCNLVCRLLLEKKKKKE